MRKKKILIAIAFVVLSLLYGTYRAYYYSDGWRRIDLRKTWPKGNWIDAKFIVTTQTAGKKWESVVFEVPPEKLQEFERKLEEEIKNSPKFYYPMLDEDQLRITTSNGKYYARVRGEDDYLMAERWKSHNMRQILYDWGMKKGSPATPCDSK